MKTHLLPIASVLVMNTGLLADVPHPEHPRPDFQRPAWVNLNGSWRFEFDAQDAGESEKWFEPGNRRFARTIVVPFPWESKLSGIGDTEYKGVAWYARELTLPSGEAWQDKDAWLIVGACDWEAKVWVNGKLAGEHVGGYVPFEINLAPFAKPGEKVTIIIRAKDVTDGQQPTGKQIGWYTRTSGIWQTVYLEARGRAYVQSIRGVPNVQDGTMTYDVAVSKGQGLTVRLSSPDEAFPPVETKAVDHVRIAAKVNKPELWWPESPRLYPAVIELLDGKKIVDRVETYFGLREIKRDLAPGRAYQYIYLNGKPIYLRGALHQSFHPDGIYQYPSDAVIKNDYELCKRIGINFLRIHIKAPIPRELYWADKLGVLIMQDMPNYWIHTEQSKKWFEQMLPAVIARDFNHPAIFAWVDFNETWGIEHGGYKPDHQEWVERIFHRTKELDPTRLVEDNSPCKYDHVVTDINSWHFYINDYGEARRHIAEVVEKTYPGSTFNYIGGRKQGNEPLMNSEYGGISAGLGDQDISWCFKYLTNELRLHDKICGYIYTELSDIEWEHNGFVNYDRSDKEYGYDFWHPGFSLADINGADFVVIDAPPMLVLRPGEQHDVPIKISHWSDRKGEDLKLRYRIDWLDAFGERTDGTWETREASWKPFSVVDQPPIRIDANKAGRGITGALLVEVLDGNDVVARNYVNVLIDGGPLPRMESVASNRFALRFGPTDFARWSFGGQGPQKLSAEKVASQGAGVAEYEIRIPKGLEIDRLKELTILAELAAKAGDEKLDWPAVKRSVRYPQTDGKKWPSDVVISVNGEKIASVKLPDDPADARGALSHHKGYQGSYGYLVRQSIKDRVLDKLRAGLAQNRTVRIRIEVPADAEHKGGLAVFSANAGCYPVDPTVLLTFDGEHGLGSDYRSNDPVAQNTGLKVLIPTAESGRHQWRFTTDQPAGEWTSATFDDSAWKLGAGGFGTRGTPNAIVSTRWNKPDIWLRTSIEVEPSAQLSGGYWRLYHDEDVEIYVNGRRVLERKDYVQGYVEVPLSPEAIAAFKPGRNTIAVHCRQTGGGQNIDVGLVVIQK